MLDSLRPEVLALGVDRHSLPHERPHYQPISYNTHTHIHTYIDENIYRIEGSIASGSRQ